MTCEVVKTAQHFSQIPAIRTSIQDHLQKNPLDVTRLIFIRHGESESNVARSVAGRTLDTPLSQKGESQADEAGKTLKEIKIQQAFSSPVRRTLSTAAKIFPQILPEQDERLHEKFYGPYEGASEESYAPIKKKEQEEVVQFKTFAEKFSYKAHPEIESLQEIYLRISAFIQEKKFPGQTIAVTTHAGLMKALFMGDSASRGFDVGYHSFDLGNCAILVVESDLKGNFQVVASRGLSFRTK